MARAEEDRRRQSLVGKQTAALSPARNIDAALPVASYLSFGCININTSAIRRYGGSLGDSIDARAYQAKSGDAQ